MQIGFFIGLIVTSTAALLMHLYQHRKLLVRRFGKFVILAALIDITASIAVAVASAYFAFPTVLTFGHHIGGFMPTLCAESMIVKGIQGWLCFLVDCSSLIYQLICGKRNTTEEEFSLMPKLMALLVIAALWLISFACVMFLVNFKPKMTETDCESGIQAEGKGKEASKAC
jgi:hypothetical protein